MLCNSCGHYYSHGLLLEFQEEQVNEDHTGRGKTSSVGTSFDAGNVMRWGPICKDVVRGTRTW